MRLIDNRKIIILDIIPIESLRKYNEILALRVAEHLYDLPNVEEKLMFDGLFFLVNHKMCISVHLDDIMLRVNPEILDSLEVKSGWTQMTIKSKPVKGYILVSEDVLFKNEELDYWIELALEYNPLAKQSHKKVKSQK